MASKSSSQGPGGVPWAVIVPVVHAVVIWPRTPAVRTAATKSCCMSASTANGLSGRAAVRLAREKKER